MQGRVIGVVNLVEIDFAIPGIFLGLPDCEGANHLGRGIVSAGNFASNLRLINSLGRSEPLEGEDEVEKDESEEEDEEKEATDQDGGVHGSGFV